MSIKKNNKTVAVNKVLVDTELRPDGELPVSGKVIYDAVQELQTNIDNETLARTEADSDLQSQVNDINITIDTYGDIVTHDFDEVATAEQGLKADTALQPTDIIDNTTSTATDKPLSANAGKSLQDQLNNLLGRGKYLSIWNSATGLAMDEPPVDPYTYETGSYFIVGVLADEAGINYRPSGSSYSSSTPSTEIETEQVKVNDTYYYDGTVWRLLSTPVTDVAFSTLAGSPYDNLNLGYALNTKYDASNPNNYQTNTQVNSAITSHNTSNSAHNDIRGLIDLKQSKTDTTLTTTAKTIVGAINELEARPSMPALDEQTITTNTDDELQVIGTVEKNAGAIKYDWIGTKAEHEEQQIATLHPTWICFITDDYESPSTTLEWGNITGDIEDQTDLKEALDNKSNDNAVVHLTGAETIAPKTFETTGVASSVVLNNTTNSSALEFRKMGVTQGFIGVAASKVPFFANNISGNWAGIVRSTLNTAVGSATQPVYINGSGVATTCTAYSDYHDNTKQDATDNTLTTTDKTIVGAINELNAKEPELDEYTAQDIQTLWEGL